MGEMHARSDIVPKTYIISTCRIFALNSAIQRKRSLRHTNIVWITQATWQTFRALRTIRF